jgi:GH25 family lysozyme M1 (1,4-beta-N-acetylmuramidase)
MAELIKGMDISTIQGKVDFAACAAAGIQFVVCRCGVGNDGKDSDYDHNVAAATAAGIKVAAYHFVYPLPPVMVNGIDTHPTRDPVKQAQLHAGWAGTSSVPVICCDLEWPLQQDWGKWGCSAAQIVQWVTTYLQAYEAATGIRPLVYTFPYFAQVLNLPVSFGQTYQLWIASYEPSPAIPHPWTDWVMWQDSSGPYHLPTTGVPVDTDKVRDLSLWNAPVAIVVPTPTPVPVPVPPAPSPVPVVVPVVVPPPPPVPAVPSPASNVFLTLWRVLSGLFK